MEDIVRQRVTYILQNSKTTINSLSKGDKTVQRRLNRQINEGASITLDTISSILEAHPNVSSEWLLTGKGDMLKSDITESPDGIPLCRSEAAAGFLSGDYTIEGKDVEARYKIREMASASFMLHVSGESMQPTYNNGDIIAVKKVLERSDINWGKVYLIATGSRGLLIKRIYDNGDSIIAVSDNPTFKPFVIGWSDINGLAYVMGSVRFEGL